MKFKASPKDFMIFCVYCVLLLYFCAIAVLNFESLTYNGEFYGLNPFPAFGPEYIGYTIGLFILTLLFIFLSVSSYIFDKDKGSKSIFSFRLSKDKTSDGYAKWASESDIKESSGIKKVKILGEKVDGAGIPLINNGKEMWVDDGEYHNLVIGSTGSGKTECLVKPMVNVLSRNGESMIITDPKGELYDYFGDYLKKQGYRIIILNFREPDRGNAWNPLALPYYFYKNGNRDKAIELLEDVSQNIIYDKNVQDPFWESSAADYFSGLALSLFEDAKEEQINFNSINYMSTVGEERRGPVPYIKEYFQMKGEDSTAYIFASNTITAPNETKGSILSTFRQKIRLFSTKDNLSEMLSYSDFDMREIGNEKTAVFMIIHDEKKTYHSLMTIFIKQCYETLIDCARENGGKLKNRTNFILDEFANMPPLKDVGSMISAARSRDIRFTFIIQNYSQLDGVYGSEVAETIKGNCGNLIYLISTELKALKEISEMCGEVKSKEKDKTASTPLITVSDLQKLKQYEAFIKRLRFDPLKTKLTPSWKINWGINFGKAELPKRDLRKIELFDLKKYVSEKKKDDTFNNPIRSDINPFMGGGFNPFMSSQPVKEPTPFTSMSSKEIDDMVKDIEKKLKELDEEEAKENAKSEEISIKPIKEEKVADDEISSLADAINNLDDKHIDDDMDKTQEINLKDINNQVINVDKESKVVNENVITDDEFYDDFFVE